MDVIELLKKDHQAVTKLFQRAKSGPGGRERRSTVEQICDELDVHAQVEEELFYPAVRGTGNEELKRLVDESLGEHQRVKGAVAALRDMDASDDQVQPALSGLEQDVEHHVTEEEGEMFPRVEEAMEARQRSEIGRRIQARKREMGGEEEEPRRSGTARRPKPARGRGAKRSQRRGKTANRPKSTRRKTSGRKAGGRKTGSRKRARGGRR